MSLQVGKWPLAIAEQVYPDTRGHVRTVAVRMSTQFVLLFGLSILIFKKSAEYLPDSLGVGPAHFNRQKWCLKIVPTSIRM